MRPEPALIVTLIGLIVSLPARLSAQPADIDKKERDALAACDGQDVKKGVALLGRLYADTLEPTYIYNQGRCYQKNGKAAEAVTRFREFLRVNKDPGSELVQRARDFIAELESEKTGPVASPAATSPPPPAPRPLAPAPAPVRAQPEIVPPPSPAAPAPEAAIASPAPAPQGPHTLRVTSFVVGGVGLLAIGSGIYHGIQVNKIENEVEGLYRANSSDPAIDPRMQDGEAAELRQWISYGVGAGCIAAGLTMYLLSRQRSEPAMGLAPLWRAHAAGAVLTGAF